VIEGGQNGVVVCYAKVFQVVEALHTPSPLRPETIISSFVEIPSSGSDSSIARTIESSFTRYMSLVFLPPSLGWASTSDFTRSDEANIRTCSLSADSGLLAVPTLSHGPGAASGTR